jgi:hypothetical protein
MNTDIVKRAIKQTAVELLPENKLWTNRFQVKSETSDSLYTIAQNKSNRSWSCSCRGYIRHRHCKHLDAVGLPGNSIAYEVGQLT